MACGEFGDMVPKLSTVVKAGRCEHKGNNTNNKHQRHDADNVNLSISSSVENDDSKIDFYDKENVIRNANEFYKASKKLTKYQENNFTPFCISRNIECEIGNDRCLLGDFSSFSSVHTNNYNNIIENKILSGCYLEVIFSFKFNFDFLILLKIFSSFYVACFIVINFMVLHDHIFLQFSVKF